MLIETAYRNLKKSAKIAEVTRNFIRTRKHPDKYRKTHLPGQVDFLAVRVTFNAHLPNRKWASDKSSSINKIIS